jgi:replicative DNA helicase
LENKDQDMTQNLQTITLAPPPRDVTGTPTGFHHLDRMTAGLQAGDLIVLAGRPAMGNTSLAINIAEHVALNEGLPVAVFSIETHAKPRAMISGGGFIRAIDQGNPRTGKLTDEWSSLAETVDGLLGIRLNSDEAPSLALDELRARARRLAGERGKPGLIVVDCLQVINGDRGGNEARANEIARGLKELALELQCPVIALAHLSRCADARAGQRPMMSDLRKCGPIENAADLVMLIHCNDYYNDGNRYLCQFGMTEIIIAKQRNGPTGSVNLLFRGWPESFENLTMTSANDGFRLA